MLKYSMEGCRVPQQEMVKYNFLPRVPARSERLSSVNPRLISIAGHELNHVLVGHRFGYSGDISLRPEGDSLARATFHGHIPLEVFQVMAAAGAVDTPDGERAYGYGMDLFAVDLINHKHGDMSRSEAIADASAVLSSYPKEVRQRAAEIVAFMREVPSFMIPQILERAKEELISENREMACKGLEIPDQNTFLSQDQGDNKTIIEETDASYRIIYVEGENFRDEMIICKLCGGINAHSPNCPRISSVISIEDGQKLEEKGLPDSGNIFTLGQPTRLTRQY